MQEKGISTYRLREECAIDSKIIRRSLKTQYLINNPLKVDA